jgi:hypothetical protein
MLQLNMLKDRLDSGDTQQLHLKQVAAKTSELHAAGVPRQKTDAADDALVRYANTEGNSLQLNENLVSGEYPEKLAKL